MKLVFLDSGAFFAHIVKEDAHHTMAVRLFDEALEDHWNLITTNTVLIEAYALLLYRSTAGRKHAMGLLDSIEAGLCHVERISEHDEQLAWDIVRTHDDKNYSLCDALSFAVMERLEIGSAIAFDKHFRQYGQFELLGM